jgi:hypothetical protein
MVALVAALSCLAGGCQQEPEMAAGYWALHAQVGDDLCTGEMDIELGDEGEVMGVWTLCGDRAGKVTGQVRSNEVLLELELDGSSGPPLRLRAFLVGDRLSGELDEGEVEGWRGDPPLEPPDSAPPGEAQEDAEPA